MSAESPARDVARAVADPAERSVEDVVLERIAERDARSARGSTALARDLFREQDELLARLADVEPRRAEAERRARESEARAVSLEEELALTRARGEISPEMRKKLLGESVGLGGLPEKPMPSNIFLNIILGVFAIVVVAYAGGIRP